MERTRIFILSALFLIGFMLWNAWQNEFPKTTGVITTAPTVPTVPTAVPSIAKTAAAAGAYPSQPPASQIAPTISNPTLVKVTTDVLSVAIDPQGGNIVQASFLKYPESLSDKDKPFQLLTNDAQNWYVAQSGLVGKQGPDTEQGQATYKVQKMDYTLAPDQNSMTVDLVWKNNSGLTIHKQFIFNRNDYRITVQYQVSNHSNSTWSGQLYAQLQRKKPQTSNGGMFNISSYTGAAISSPGEPYKKLSFSKLADQNLNMSIQGGWAAMLQHYFLSAWVPPSSQSFNYYSQVTKASDEKNNIYTLGMIGPALIVAPNSQATANMKLYTGPESMDLLKSTAPNLDLTVDYGILWFLSIGIFWLLKHLYDILGNWGWAIVAVTILIKLAFYHLSAKSYKSMAALRKLQPRMQAIRERYGDDRQKATQATMELYRSEKVNPMSGCLPIIVQIPVFIALYWVLLESVELRQAPWILWIHDLSVRDPYFVLPILMGITMYIQQKLNPPPPDPTQAKMMQFLPVFFTFLFLNFPAGLVLYWVVNNALSILQQWYIMRKVNGQ